MLFIQQRKYNMRFMLAYKKHIIFSLAWRRSRPGAQQARISLKFEPGLMNNIIIAALDGD
jgi:hypothetical protein